MLKFPLTLAAILTVASLVFGQASEPTLLPPPELGPTPICRSGVCCVPSRTAMTAVRPVALPVAVPAGGSSTPVGGGTLGRVVEVLERYDARMDRHESRFTANEARLGELERWRGEVDQKLDFLLQKNSSYPSMPPAVIPPSPVQPPMILHQRPAAGGNNAFAAVGWTRDQLIELEKSLDRLTSDPARRFEMRQTALQHPNFNSYLASYERQLAMHRASP